jgi:hypothetical protein
MRASVSSRLRKELVTRNGVGIFVGAGDDPGMIIPDRISDWDWRAANVSTSEGKSLDDDTRVWPKDIIESDLEPCGFLYE